MWDLFNVHTLIIQTINLAIIILLLRKFLFKPYLGYVLEQEAKQKEIDASAATIATLRSQAEEQIQGLLADAHTKASEVRAQAKDVASSQADVIIEDANKQADRIKQQAEDQIATLERSLQEKYTQSVTRAAISVNKKLFSDTSDANADFIKANI